MAVHLPEDVLGDIYEAVDSRALSQGTFSLTEASTTVEYVFDIEDRPQDYSDWIVNDVVVTVLGANYVSEMKLCRVPPLRHPLHPSLYASRITGLRGEGPLGRTDEQIDFLGAEIAENTPIRWGTWKRLRFVVEYTLPQWRICADGEVDAEYKRYVVPELQPGVEVITIAAGQMKFAENPGPGYDPPTAINTQFQSETALVLPKQTFTLLWKSVPQEFISADGGQTFRKLEEYVGKVNQSEFLGRAAGTLLMNPPKLTRYACSLFLPPDYRPQILYDVLFEFSYFRPPKANPDSPYEGHNLLPWRGAKTSARGARYLYATDTGTTLGSPLFDRREFDNLFTHVNLDSTVIVGGP